MNDMPSGAKNCFSVMKLRLMCAVLSAMTLAVIPASVLAETPPNFVVIFADDLGYGDLHCYGSPYSDTPHLDQMAAEGKKFTSFYVAQAVCSASRTALLTGCYPNRVGIQGALGPANNHGINDHEQTIAEVLKLRGYASAIFGKWHLGLTAGNITDWSKPITPGPRQVGFDHYYGLVANLPAAPHGFIEDDEISDPFPSVPPASVATEPAKGRTAWKVDHVMDTLTSKLTGWIEANHTQPFFVYFAPNAVHEPVAPNARYTGSPYGKYGDFINELDGSVGQILATLDRLKLADNTIVIFTSDNGGVIEAHNENSLVAIKAGLAINGPWRGGKHSEWEGGFREPFIVRWPGQVPAGTVSDQVICLTDLLATFAHVLHAPLRPGQAEDSFNVLRAFTEGQPGAPVRGPVILQSADGTYDLRLGDWKLVERVNAPAFSPNRNKRTIAAAQKKQAAAFSRDELYNLQKDPFEMHDEWSTQQERAAAMKKILGESRDRGFTRLPAEARAEDILPAVTQP